MAAYTNTGVVFQKTLSLYSSKCCCRNQSFALINPSQFLSSNSILNLKNQTLSFQIKPFNNPRIRNYPTKVYASQSNLFKVIQTVWKVGKDGVEAGTGLVPDTIPRPIARIGVAIVAGTVGLFVLKSFLSTVFFALAVMGLSYFTFLALNKDEGPKEGGGGDGSGGGGGGPTSVDDSLEEARRIMEKYK